jgi:hypothetical protein
MERAIVNKITELCNCIDREKVVICYGDILLDDFIGGITKFRISKHPLKVNYYDCVETKPSNTLSNLCITDSLTKTDIFYILDNIEVLNQKEVNFIVKMKERLRESSKVVVLLTLNLDKIHQGFSSIKKLKVGNIDVESSLSHVIQIFFNEPIREKALHLIQNCEYPLSYLMTLISYNLPFFSRDEYPFLHNSIVLETTSKLMYKTDETTILRYLVYAFIPSELRKAIRYPPKIKSEGVKE